MAFAAFAVFAPWLLPAARAAPFLLGGIQVNEPDHGAWLDALSRAGMNTVAVTAYAKQGDWDGANLWFEDEEPAVVAEIRAAKRKGLSVVLVLRVALDHAFPRNRFLWHGLIMPAGDDDLGEWFVRYGRFVSRWAAIAEAEGVDVLAFASEMSWLTSTVPIREIPELPRWYLDRAAQARDRAELFAYAQQIEGRHLRSAGARGGEDLGAFVGGRQRALRDWAARVTHLGAPEAERISRLNARRERLEREWRALIARTRERYRGLLTYAANFDQYEDVELWDALDLVGINAYFRLRGDPDLPDAALPRELERGWRSVLERFDRFRRGRGLGDKRVLFTELGLTSRRGATLAPWEMGGFSVIGPEGKRRLVLWDDQPLAPEERALAVRALRRATREVDPGLVAGLLYWKLSTRPEHRKIEPFVLVLEQPPRDPLQVELRAFRR